MKSCTSMGEESIYEMDSPAYRSVSKKILSRQLCLFWEENSVFYQLLQHNGDIEVLRKRVFNYLSDFEKKNFVNNQFSSNQRNISRKCVNVLKNIFSKRNEELTNTSCLALLAKAAGMDRCELTIGFIEELRRLFLGMKGKADTFVKSLESGIQHNRMDTDIHSVMLNKTALKIQSRLAKYKSGLDEKLIAKRAENREQILYKLKASSEQWIDWHWQQRHIIRTLEDLEMLIELSEEEKEAVRLAKEHKLPFGITPYYVSLMDQTGKAGFDHAVRSQVIPPLHYVQKMIESKREGIDLDFMEEKNTSPVELVTRRYPMIAIFKPYNTCAQICVYCQRNWEITDVMDDKAMAGKSRIQRGLDWLKQNTVINEVLVTGGDPGLLPDHVLHEILHQLSGMEHIRRIRLGTRLPVVMPMRITEAYAEMLAGFHRPGKCEIAVMTHFEHATEVTPDSMMAVQRFKKKGIPVYNQAVYTMENARRFELVKLRQALRSIGVEPYYTFNTKGKEETRAYRVPIARLLQEQAEEARLTPGLDRTDEAVFNIPRLGKSYLRANQDHEMIMLKPDGSRVYEFFPWSQDLGHGMSYIYEDVPVFDFLKKMVQRGENVREYRSIWYYF